MNNVKLYHVGDAGLQEGEALGRISVVLKADYEVEVGELQDEVDFLKSVCKDYSKIYLEACAAEQTLQSELTKARELLNTLFGASKEMLRIAGLANQGSNAYNRAIVNLHETITKIAAHQSAPSAKAQKCLDGGTCGLGGFCKDCHNLK